jgi:hypothetical protein
VGDGEVESELRGSPDDMFAQPQTKPWICTAGPASRYWQERCPGAPPLHPLLPMTAQHPRKSEPRQDLHRLAAMVECLQLAEPRPAIPGKGTSSMRLPGEVGEDLGDAAIRLGDIQGRREGHVMEVVAAVVASSSFCCRRPWGAAASNHLPELPPLATSATSLCRSPLGATAARHQSVLLPPATSPTSVSQ